MSESGYQELDLDNPGAKASAEDSDIEIVEESPTEEAPAAAPEPEPSPARAEEQDHEEDDTSSDQSSERKRLTRSQRLKAQRDAYAEQLRDAQARLATAEARARKAEAEATEGASIGFDLYIKQLDTSMLALRRDFDAAYDAGDRDRIFSIQQEIATLAATKAQAEKERRSIPTQRAASGQAAPQQTTQTRQDSTKRAPSPAAMEWYQRNKDWFNKDPVLTASARVIDQQMVADGYTPEDPDYFEELDSRMRREFPHKFGGKAAAPARQASNPTIQNRSTPAVAPGKVRVVITQADRDMANHLGISVEQYAREKAKTERAAQTASQYTEIL